MERGYQYGFSKTVAGNYDKASRERKAKTMVAILEDHLNTPLSELSVINIGGSSGIIDNYLSKFVKSVTSIDIDSDAIKAASMRYKSKNLEFLVADAMNLPFQDNNFDIVICSQVYEHVPDAKKMMDEIFRVLSNQGVCYFAAGNRLMLNEPHYNLPLLSVIPRPLAHIYMRASGKGKMYYELHLSYWALKKIVNKFEFFDYTKKIIQDPSKYATDYMIKPGSLKEFTAKIIVKYMYWATPGYIWILEKRSDDKKSI